MSLRIAVSSSTVRTSRLVFDFLTGWLTRLVLVAAPFALLFVAVATNPTNSRSADSRPERCTPRPVRLMTFENLMSTMMSSTPKEVNKSVQPLFESIDIARGNQLKFRLHSLSSTFARPSERFGSKRFAANTPSFNVSGVICHETVHTELCKLFHTFGVIHRPRVDRQGVTRRPAQHLRINLAVMRVKRVHV